MQYTCYLDKKYEKGCLIVFDRYKSGTKDQERQRKSMQGSINAVFQLQNEVQYQQSEFIANSNSKERFTLRLTLVLHEHGHLVTICPRHADLTIFQTALKIENDRSHATVAVVNKDILVMLLINWRYELANISVRHETKRKIKKNLQMISIRKMVTLLRKVHIPTRPSN